MPHGPRCIGYVCTCQMQEFVDHFTSRMLNRDWIVNQLQEIEVECEKLGIVTTGVPVYKVMQELKAKRIQK